MAVAPRADSSDDLAHRLLPMAMVDPGRARAMAEVAIRDARRVGDVAAHAVGLRALGLAARARHDAATAARHLRASIKLAGRYGLATHEAEARMSLALILDDLGRPAAALREIDRAVVELRGTRRARATMQRALIQRRLGLEKEAMLGYRTALRTFRRRGDRAWEARTLTNRGVLHGYRGELRLAEADLRTAQALYTRLGMATAAAQVEHNLGFVAAQAGDVPTALARYDRAQAQLWNTGPDAVSLLDRAELLLSVRLLPEARTAVREAIAACRSGRLDSTLAQAHLMLARVALASNAPADARSAAASARRIFRRQGRTIWVARARCTELAALIALGRAHRGTLRDLRAAATTLLAAGWPRPGWDGLLDAAHLAVDLRELGAAREILARASAAARLGPMSLRARLWHVRALVELRAGAPKKAARAAMTGLRQAESYRASLGATELRVHGGAEAAELAGLRLRVALDQGSPARALAWLQRSRSATLWLPTARPSADPVVARHLAELRRINSELVMAPAGHDRTGRLLRRQRAVEEAVRRRSWRVPGSPDGPGGPEPSVPAIAAALGDRTLVELFVIDGGLQALVLNRRVVHRGLGPLDAVVAELDALRFALRRLVVSQGNSASRAAAAASASHGVSTLDRLLLAPLRDLIGDGRLVLAPTGALYAVPWAMLPSLQGRSLCVAPSGAVWWRASGRATHPGRTVLVGAPSAAQAAMEVDEIAVRIPQATVLTGHRARVGAVMAVLDGAHTGHIACHGEFRSDNPLFSYLMLADGPLTVYDLSSLSRPPDLLVLSACDGGLSAVHPGDELIGLVAALLNMGTRTVIASTGPVEDGAARRLMADLHARLVAGTPPADALAEAQAVADPPTRASTDSFVCFGAG